MANERKMANVRIKRIYAPVENEDGCRILVDRLWPRGISKTEARWDLWFREAAPSLKALTPTTPYMKWLENAAAGVIIIGNPDLSKYWLQDAALSGDICG